MALAGSTSRNEDAEFSDLELIVVSEKRTETSYSVKDNIVIEILSITKDELGKIVSNPASDSWPNWAGLLSNAKVLHGDSEILMAYKKRLNSIRHAEYSRAAKEKLVWILEYANHARNARSRNDLYSAIFYSLWLTNVAGEFVGFLNDSYYAKNVFRSLKEAKRFRLLPENYFELMEAIYVEKSIDKITEMCTELCENCFSLAKDAGISI